MVKERIDYVDTAKFFGIVLLLIEHTGNWIDISDPGYDNLKLWICSFHMPLFFVIYGMVASKKDFVSIHSFLTFINKQIKALIVPYVLWALIYSNGYDIDFFAGVIYGSNMALSYAGTNAVLWFLPTMFFSTIIYQFVLKFIERRGEKRKIIAFSLMTCVLIAKLGNNIASNISIQFPWGIDIAFLGVTFMLLGRYLCFPILKSIRSGRFEPICAVILAVCGCVISFVNRPVDGNYWCPVMALGVYGKSITLFILGSILSVCFILVISNLISFKLLQYLGNHSLFMMAVHYIVFPYSIYLTRMITDVFHGTIIYGTLFSVINAVVCVCAMLVLCLLSDKYCVCLNGKSN